MHFDGRSRLDQENQLGGGLTMHRQHETSSPAIVAGLDFFSTMVRHVLQCTLDAVNQWPCADVHFLAMAQAPAGLGQRKQAESREVSSALTHLRQHVTEFLAIHERARWQHTRIFLHARCGNPGEEILNLCNETRADLLIVGKSPLSHAGVIGEDMIEFVLRQSVCPALVLQPKHYDEPSLVNYYRHCPACEETRRSTAGARWFCLAHQDERLRSVAQFHAW
jgi:nucleotide-binding universal stress UspA family protein